MQGALFVTLMLAVSCAATKDLTGKMLVFPVETQSDYIKLFTDKTSFTALTACARFKTDLTREYSLMSYLLPGNIYGVLGTNSDQDFTFRLPTDTATFYHLSKPSNTWHSLCFTWSSTDTFTQLWLNGKPTIKKTIGTAAALTGLPEVILGQGHDPGAGLLSGESFVGMMTDVHSWDYILSRYEIKRYMEDKAFTPGNIHNWKALSYQMIGQVMLEDKIIL